MRAVDELPADETTTTPSDPKQGWTSSLTTTSMQPRVPESTLKLLNVLTVVLTLVGAILSTAKSVDLKYVGACLLGMGFSAAVAVFWVQQNKYASYVERVRIERQPYVVPGELEVIDVYAVSYVNGGSDFAYYFSADKALTDYPSASVRTVKVVKVGGVYVLADNFTPLPYKTIDIQ